MEKNIEISILSQIYKNTLTEKQFEILDEYYNNDFSLSEIPENYNITRQVVRDNIKNWDFPSFLLCSFILIISTKSIIS